ncbi:uncharacterized protein LAESUDRAFT_772685 [Laetiporus sulphureus 93-53]|uniref:Uncharacterized protein n=1 Tax=Laetiporus sulphureus 93-53 TaxID=1314785 RepID=A0A165EN81_9APHY|nr:uncharacterized protein LAESUDRAFT_772685 [Laetiporus sulphureus 93-53]KZT07416.1 hypothetical protein LAESUDRAFT_772685 [Laetiporus sulphureus 93-53]
MHPHLVRNLLLFCPLPSSQRLWPLSSFPAPVSPSHPHSKPQPSAPLSSLRIFATRTRSPRVASEMFRTRKDDTMARETPQTQSRVEFARSALDHGGQTHWESRHPAGVPFKDLLQRIDDLQSTLEVVTLIRHEEGDDIPWHDRVMQRNDINLPRLRRLSVAYYPEEYVCHLFNAIRFSGKPKVSLRFAARKGVSVKIFDSTCPSLHDLAHRTKGAHIQYAYTGREHGSNEVVFTFKSLDVSLEVAWDHGLSQSKSGEESSAYAIAEAIIRNLPNLHTLEVELRVDSAPPNGVLLDCLWIRKFKDVEVVVRRNGRKEFIKYDGPDHPASSSPTSRASKSERTRTGKEDSLSMASRTPTLSS